MAFKHNTYTLRAKVKKLYDECSPGFDTFASAEQREERRKRSDEDTNDRWHEGQAEKRYVVRQTVKQVLAAAGWTYHGPEVGRFEPFMAYTDARGTQWKVYPNKLCFVPRGMTDGYEFSCFANLAGFLERQLQEAV